jgi:NAD(P)-dependent dehydrogenase (short-subunit alcohol dehydrogenase family)
MEGADMVSNALPFDLDGQVAIVTGGTGIGTATTRVLASSGAPVVISSRKPENLERADPMC